MKCNPDSAARKFWPSNTTALPDLICCGKGITSPALVGSDRRAEIMDQFPRFMTSTTRKTQSAARGYAQSEKNSCRKSYRQRGPWKILDEVSEKSNNVTPM